MCRTRRTRRRAASLSARLHLPGAGRHGGRVADTSSRRRWRFTRLCSALPPLPRPRVDRSDERAAAPRRVSSWPESSGSLWVDVLQPRFSRVVAPREPFYVAGHGLEIGCVRFLRLRRRAKLKCSLFLSGCSGHAVRCLRRSSGAPPSRVSRGWPMRSHDVCKWTHTVPRRRA